MNDRPADPLQDVASWALTNEDFADRHWPLILARAAERFAARDLDGAEDYAGKLRKTNLAVRYRGPAVQVLRIIETVRLGKTTFTPELVEEVWKICRERSRRNERSLGKNHRKP